MDKYLVADFPSLFAQFIVIVLGTSAKLEPRPLETA